MLVMRWSNCPAISLSLIMAFAMSSGMGIHAGEMSADPSAGAASSRLTGQVTKVRLSLERLRDVGLDLKQVIKAASSLYDEVTIQPVTMVTEPEVIGMGTIIYLPIATRPAGPPQPPRKDRLELSMSEITPVVDLLKKNCDEFVEGRKQLDLPEDVHQKIEPMVKEWVRIVNDVNSQVIQLKALTVGPHYDNSAIASTAMSMEKDVKSLDKVRRSIYKVIRKEGKRIADEQDKEAGREPAAAARPL